MVSRLTFLENLSISARVVTASIIFLISQARSILFLPTLAKPLEASMISTSVLSRFCLSTIIIVGMPVPKKMLAGKPIIASMWLYSIKFWRIFPSSPPRNNTPCGSTIAIIPSGFKWYKSCSKNA